MRYHSSPRSESLESHSKNLLRLKAGSEPNLSARFFPPHRRPCACPQFGSGLSVGAKILPSYPPPFSTYLLNHRSVWFSISVLNPSELGLLLLQRPGGVRAAMATRRPAEARLAPGLRESAPGDPAPCRSGPAS